MHTPPENVVSIFGANDAVEGDQAYQAALAVGRRLAELGYVIANGGYGGTMEASARGAKDAGGSTMGVTCSVWPTRPNAYIDEVFTTGKPWQRVQTLVALGKAGYVILPGATGTLVELATVWESICKDMLPARPVVCMGRFWAPLIEMMDSARPGCGRVVAVAETPEQLGQFFDQL